MKRSVNHDIEHRDWRETLSVAESMGGADLIMTSPPYPDARSPSQYGGAYFDTSVEGYGELGDKVIHALKPGGVCALNIDGPIRVWRPELGESERSLIAFEVAIDWARRVGLRYIERCLYAREGVPGSHGPRWRSGGELVHVFSRPGAPVFFDPWGYTESAKRAGMHYSDGSSRKLGGQSARGSWDQHDRRMLSTVIRCSVGHNKTDSDHPAPFSQRLSDAYVLCYSPPGGLVCDPFIGSGTVGRSAHDAGRRFIGGDFGFRASDGKPWADIAREKLRQQTLKF